MCRCCLSPPGVGGSGVLIVVHGRSLKTIDPRIPTMPRRSASGFHLPEWRGAIPPAQQRGRASGSSASAVSSTSAQFAVHGMINVLVDLWRWRRPRFAPIPALINVRTTDPFLQQRAMRPGKASGGTAILQFLLSLLSSLPPSPLPARYLSDISLLQIFYMLKLFDLGSTALSQVVQTQIISTVSRVEVAATHRYDADPLYIDNPRSTATPPCPPPPLLSTGAWVFRGVEWG